MLYFVSETFVFKLPEMWNPFLKLILLMNVLQWVCLHIILEMMLLWLRSLKNEQVFQLISCTVYMVIHFIWWGSPKSRGTHVTSLYYIHVLYCIIYMYSIGLFYYISMTFPWKFDPDRVKILIFLHFSHFQFTIWFMQVLDLLLLRCY